MLELETAEHGFLLLEPLFGVRELAFEKLRGAFRFDRPLSYVLINEEVANLLGDLGDERWVGPLVRDPKCGWVATRAERGPVGGERDVGPRLIADLFGRHVLPFLVVEVKALDQLHEARITQDLIANGVQAVLQTGGDGGRDVVFGDTL